VATQFKLTWRREGRWRKKYKGQSYYFAAPEGKLASYQRCLAEWQKKKAEIDQQIVDEDPSRQAWRSMIQRVAKMLAEFSAVDTPENRARWRHWHAQMCTYQYLLNEGIPYCFTDEELSLNPAELPLMLGGGQILDVPDPPPPWDQVKVEVDTGKSLQGNIDRFLHRKRQQVERGQLSHGRYDSLRISLENFSQHVGGTTPIASINGRELRSFHDGLEKAIDQKKLNPFSARDRLAAVKQFIRWAWGEELMSLPRILESREFSIALPETKIETFTDEEVSRLLNSSSPSTKLYLLLMLNCGFTQQDIAELRQDEVDWKLGRVTRKRSKTRKRKGENVPEVCYQLWPETFKLLKQHRSKDKTLALTNQKGQPLKTEEIVNGRVKKIDNVRSAFNRVVSKLVKEKHEPIKITKALKLMRKTAATKLGQHPEFGRFAQYYLGHAPATVADRHYVVPSQPQFDRALVWLGEQLAPTPSAAARTLEQSAAP
jgi:integrase